MLLLFLCILLFIIYAWLVLYYWFQWEKIPEPMLTSRIKDLRVSVIIPARNEESNIGNLLTALRSQDYPRELLEIIVVDDHSTDQTTAIVSGFENTRLISLSEEGINSYKKKAIETGIAASTGELIITTDSDCIPGNRWISIMVDHAVKNNAEFVAAPVVIACNNSVLQMFQALDFMILQAITGAVVQGRQLSMCNGANMAYSRKAFDEVNGFSGIDHIASGDDMLLMYKIWKRYPDGVVYLKSKEAIVSTQPQDTWKNFFQQRIRWASKAANYEDKRFFPVLLLVYLFNLSFAVLAIAGFFNSQYWLYLGALWIGKTLVELPLFWSAANFFEKRWAIKVFFFFQPLHIAYTIISGFLGQIGKYEWKGRRVR